MNDHAESMENPYPGLRPFQADETHLFFGRDEQRTELLGRLRRSRFLAVVGTSGSGKSSLVRAGLLPGLYGGFMAGGASRWRIVDTRPAGDPIGRLAKALDSKDALRPDDDDDISFTEAALRRTSLGLVNVVKEARLPEGERVLVLVDQFEELFRFVDTAKSDRSRDDASAFVKLLLAAAEQDDVPIYVVITMRSDFLGDCARFRDLPEAINDGQYLIPRLTRDQRREAITGPASVCGTRLTPTLVNRLLNDVGDTPDQLPILQHALMRTFDRWQVEHPDSDTIDLDDYENVGGMSHALSRHADTVFKELGDGVDAEERRRRWHIAEKLFKCITDMGKRGRKIRRLAKLQDIAAVAEVSVEEVATVIEAFRRKNNSFLMPPIGEELQPDTLIDISHESLIRNWSRLNRWVDQEAESANDYRLLAQKAELHEKGEEDLLGRQALRVANEWKEKQQPTRAWADRYDADFEAAMDFLAKSDARVTAHREAEERRKRIKRAVVIGAVIAIVTPMLMFLLFAGEEAEWAVKEESNRLKVLNGGADRELLTFLNPSSSAQDSSDSYYSQPNFGPTDLAIWLENNGAFDHAEIVWKYTNWQTERGERLLEAIWRADLEPERLIDAIVELDVPRWQLEEQFKEQPGGPTLDTLLDTIYAGGIGITTHELQYVLSMDLTKKSFRQKGSAYSEPNPDGLAFVDESDRWLVSVYEARADGQIDKTEFDEIKEAFRDDDEYRPQHDIAEKVVFRTLLSRLRDLASKPVDDLAKHGQELDDMLDIFEDLEESRVEEPEEPSGTEVGSEFHDESNIVGTDGEQDSQGRVFKSVGELTIDELEQTYKRFQAASKLPKTSGNSEDSDERLVNAPDVRNAEDRRKIAFVWTVKRLKETVEQFREEGLPARLSEIETAREQLLSESEEDREELLEEIEEKREELLDDTDDAREEIVESAIFASIGEVEAAPFTLWRLRDNQLYRTLEENSAFQSVKQKIVEYYYVLFLGLLWFVWSGLRRSRARKGKNFASHVGLFRMGLASLVDVFVASIVGLIATLAVGSFGALLVAIGSDTFEHTDLAMGASSVLVFVPVAVGYLLLRDVMHFRYRRSFGKILFEFRPIDTKGDSLSRGASFKRNWIIFIGIFLALFVTGISFAAVDFLFGEEVSSWEPRNQITLILAIGFFESVFLLGLFEKLGGRWSKTTVIDTRSNESAIAASSQPSATELQPAST